MPAIAAVVAVTSLAFLPLLTNGFVNWDDPFTLQNNARLAAPGVLKWSFTTTEMGHYQPLAWLAWSEVKSLFGLNAVAFHALSLLGHLLNSVLVYFVSIRLASAGDSKDDPGDSRPSLRRSHSRYTQSAWRSWRGRALFRTSCPSG